MNKKKLIFILTLILATCVSACGHMDTTEKAPPEPSLLKDAYEWIQKENIIETEQAYFQEGVNFESKLFNSVEYKSADEKYKKLYENVQGIYFEGAKLKDGTSSEIFAYLGMPKSATPTNRVPGVVLVHGGGGTAFAAWVNEWVKRGYAAIAFDSEGYTPEPTKEILGAAQVKHKNSRGGPNNDQYQLSATQAVEDTFLFHATSAAIASNTILRNLDVVDPSKVGITGISWGGVIASVATGYDDRFAFSVPVYGCLNLVGSHGIFGDLYEKQEKARIWDDSTPYAERLTPTLWINGTQDQHFSADATNLSYLQGKQALMSLQYGLAHGHKFDIEEVYRFADSVVRQGTKLIKITKHPTFDDATIEFLIPIGVSVSQVKMYLSESLFPETNTFWVQQSVDYAEGKTKALVIEERYNMFYFEITDIYGCKITSAIAYR